MKHNIDWAYFRTYAEVNCDDNSGIELKYELREVSDTKDEFCSKALLNSKKVNEEAIFGDERFKKNINKVFYLDLTLTAKEEVVFPKTVIDIRLPIDNMQSLWLPGLITPCKNARPKGMFEYATLTTHICNLSPMGAFYSAEGVNKVSFALSDCKNIVNVRCGAYEEEECGRITFELFTVPCHKMKEYKVSVRLDTSFVPVFKAIQSIGVWYEKSFAKDIMPVPEAAIEPVYSTWYAFLQNITDKDIEEQCEIASKLGCKTVIVDDGWQTDDNNRGYTFCGDWEISKRRFPNMKEHVKKVHDMGMRYLVWFSVPFIGAKSKNIAKFEGKFLCFNKNWNAYVLDPRYKEVRQFLVDTFTNMVKEYDLDGLKLDFIDEFDMRQADEHAQAFDAARDTQSLPDAVDMLMTEVRRSLESVKSDIIIEFRQNYIGPMIRKYGNMFRAHDCPNDTLMNRMTTLDLRAFCGHTAIHSDMYIWSPTESVESASLNFIHTLFAVPQISPNLKHLSDEHIAMIKHWLGFWREHRDLLLNGTIRATHPEFMYAEATVAKGDEGLKLVNAQIPVNIFANIQEEACGAKKLTLVNGAMTESLLVRYPVANETIKLDVEIFNCLGKSQGKSQIEVGNSIYELKMPKSGYAVMTRA